MFAQALKLVAEIEKYGRPDPLKAQFEAIDVLNFHSTFDGACAAMLAMLQAMAP